jgi:hypothetical protein
MGERPVLSSSLTQTHAILNHVPSIARSVVLGVNGRRVPLHVEPELRLGVKPLYDTLRMVALSAPILKKYVRVA